MNSYAMSFHPRRHLWTILIFLSLSFGTASAAKLRVLHAFAGGTDGAFPQGGLVFDRTGNLYGVTEQGGNGTGCSDYGCGVMYQLVHGAQWSERVLYNYSVDNGYSYFGPQGSLLLSAGGTMYGVAGAGGDPTCHCGEIYELSRISGGWTKSTLYSFVGTDGAVPGLGLLRDSLGNLYGVTVQDGIYNNGTLFKLAPNGDGTWTESVVYAFGGYRDGGNPYGTPVMDAAGNLYGATQSGGVYGFGTVFKLSFSNGSWNLTTLYSFTGGDTGGNPDYGMVLDSDGNLYGTTFSGGANLVGTVFKLSPGSPSWHFSLLHTFSGNSDGGHPDSALVIDSSGNVYGTTESGGSYQYGSVYKLSNINGKWQETVLHSFTGGTDGQLPWGGLVLDTAGNVYGVATSGGAYGYGVAYEIVP